jgi:hypothetical protein
VHASPSHSRQRLRTALTAISTRNCDASFEARILDRARLLAAQASLSAPALADPSPEVRWTMTSRFQPSLDRLWLNRRGLVVAVAGIVFGVMSRASLVEGSRDRLRFCANQAAVAGAHRISTRKSRELGEGCAGADTRAPRPGAIAPKRRVEIARN